jgi:hypothetical protein
VSSGVSKSSGERLLPEFAIEQRHEARERRAGERLEHGVGDRGRHLALADPMPLHLPVERPVVQAERLLPQLLQRVPVGIPDRNAAEREQPALVELPALVQKEQVHAAETRHGAPHAHPVVDLGRASVPDRDAAPGHEAEPCSHEPPRRHQVI